MLALVVSLGATYFLYSRMKRQLAKSATTRIVASSAALEPGTQLTADQLVLVEWPSTLPLEGAFTKPEDVVGRILLYPVLPQEPIRNQLLASPGAAIGLTSKIPDGMRAVAIVTNQVINVSGFLFPGSHVDVMVTFHADQGQQPMTTTVLQNIEVLTTGDRLLPDPAGKPQDVKVVTLLMSPDDAQKLGLASNFGTVQFALRNGADQAQAERRPVFMQELQGNFSAPAPRAPAANRTVAAHKSNDYEVEVFEGTKKSVQKF